jgi:hypothetical protein
MGEDPDAADNRWLRRAHEAQVPVLYFLGVALGSVEIHRELMTAEQM